MAWLYAVFMTEMEWRYHVAMSREKVQHLILSTLHRDGNIPDTSVLRLEDASDTSLDALMIVGVLKSLTDKKVKGSPHLFQHSLVRW